MTAEQTWFWQPPPVLTVAELAAAAGASVFRAPPEPEVPISRVAPIETAGVGDVVFFDNLRYLGALARCRATACIVSPRYQDKPPAAMAVLLADQPARAVAVLLAKMYPAALRPGSLYGEEAGVSPDARLHPLARLERGVQIDPGAIVGAGAEIGENASIGANAVVGAGVKIGRHCAIGAGVTVQHALIGNAVIVHPGARIGQDGFGFAMGAKGHLKAPQVGRVIIQDHVEIGANTTIDRGAIRDTVIGEGTKIDNLVQIGHNVVIGRHCVIAALVGISGSCRLGDFVALGGQIGIAGHLTVGSGAQVAAQSGIMHDVPPGARWGGTPAKPMREWMREIAVLKKMASRPAAGVTAASDEN